MRFLIRQACRPRRKKFLPGKTRIPLAVPSYGFEEIAEAVDSLLSGNVTMGEKVQRFERMFANYLGVKEGVMVNSGSTANLVSMSVLSNPDVHDPIKPGDEVITPAVTWSTTFFPIAGVRAIPVLVDIDSSTYNCNYDQMEDAITDKTKALVIVHLLGNPCDMNRIRKIARGRGLYLVEDACEAHGAEVSGRKVGSFGDVSTFSFYLSHHITTIEGGMLVTNNEQFAELSRSMRAHGWIREMKGRKLFEELFPNIDSRYMFVTMGSNFRPTEIQGAFGIHQLPKLERFIRAREENARYLNDALSKYSRYLKVPERRKGTRHVWFGYPVTVTDNAPFRREDLVNFLERRLVETRPIMSGNFAEQPVIHKIPHRIHGSLQVAQRVTKQSFFVGIHQGIMQSEREYLAKCFDDFISQKV